MAPAFKIEQCRSDDCQAPIIWARTLSGRSMPIDANPSPDGNVSLQIIQGITRVTVHAKPVYEGRTSHFATCPAAEKWRNRK